MRHISVICILGFVCLDAASGQCADANANEVVERFFLERQRLYAGDVRIRGIERRTSFRQNAKRNNWRDIAERLRFDLLRGRVWHEQELNSLDAHPSDNSLHRIVVFGAEGAYIKSVESKQITVSVPRPPQKFWDVRAFGVGTAVDLMDFTPFSVHKAAIDHYLEQDRVSMEGPDADGIAIVTIEHGSDPENRSKIDGRSRVWIDTSRGHVPVRMEGQKLDAEALSAGKKTWKPPIDSVTTSWELVDDVWVPTSVSAEHIAGIPNRDSLIIGFDLALEWFEVNPELEEEEFSIKRLDIPEGSHLIVDARNDSAKPIMIQHPGIQDAAALKRMRDGLTEANRTEPERRRWTVAVSVMAFLVLLLALVMGVRHVARS